MPLVVPGVTTNDPAVQKTEEWMNKLCGKTLADHTSETVRTSPVEKWQDRDGVQAWKLTLFLFSSAYRPSASPISQSKPASSSRVPWSRKTLTLTVSTCMSARMGRSATLSTVKEEQRAVTEWLYQA